MRDRGRYPEKTALLVLGAVAIWIVLFAYGMIPRILDRKLATMWALLLFILRGEDIVLFLVPVPSRY